MRILGETICRHDVTTDEARIRFGHCVTPCCACRKRFDVMLGARNQCSRARGMYGGHGTVGAKDESIKSSFNATHTHTLNATICICKCRAVRTVLADYRTKATNINNSNETMQIYHDRGSVIIGYSDRDAVVSIQATFHAPDPSDSRNLIRSTSGRR